jgi:hypothetical protein
MNMLWTLGSNAVGRAVYLGRSCLVTHDCLGCLVLPAAAAAASYILVKACIVSLPCCWHSCLLWNGDKAKIKWASCYKAKLAACFAAVCCTTSCPLEFWPLTLPCTSGYLLGKFVTKSNACKFVVGDRVVCNAPRGICIGVIYMCRNSSLPRMFDPSVLVHSLQPSCFVCSKTLIFALVPSPPPPPPPRRLSPVSRFTYTPRWAASVVAVTLVPGLLREDCLCLLRGVNIATRAR